MSSAQLVDPKADVPRFRVVPELVAHRSGIAGVKITVYWVLERLPDLGVDSVVCECAFEENAQRVVDALMAHEQMAEAIVIS